MKCWASSLDIRNFLIENAEENVVKSFQYTIADSVGIHIRTITPLIKKAREFPGCEFTISKNDNTVNLFRTSAVLKMAVKGGDTVTITVTGDGEEAAAEALKTFFQEHL